MPEMRVSHLIILAVLFAIVVFPLLVFGGIIGGFWFITKENMDKGVAAAKGYTTARDPAQAMDKFREAIHTRDYKSASYYCTKNYADMLRKSHDNAADLGNTIDKIRDWGTSKGLMTDKLRVTLYALDPFPKNFKSGPAPKQEGENKAYGNYVWEVGHTLENPIVKNLEDMKLLDPRMFRNVLCVQAFAGKIQLVKAGEDWKIDVTTTPLWETEVSYFNDRCKTYQTGMHGMWKDLNNERYDTKGAFERDIMATLIAAK